eukprot:jgi/Tetstr1/429940/TSEL_019803.t1
MGKMTPKSWPGIYVDHHEDSAGYRIYNAATRRETVTRDVIFDEMAALAMPASNVRVSNKAPRNYKEAISSNHPDDWKQPMDREIDSITKMEHFTLSLTERNRQSARRKQ